MSLREDVDNPDDDLRSLVAEQRRKIMAMKDLESDMDLAFELQLQEAINASLSLHPSTSSADDSPPSPPRDLLKPHRSNNFSDLQSEELLKFEQEIKDRLLSETEFKKIRDDLHRRIHDQKLAEEIDNMPDGEWNDIGDNFERPFGEGSSKSVNSEVFRVYFKGLVQKGIPAIDGDKFTFENEIFSGIGVAICDSRGELLFEVKKPLSMNGMNRQVVELKALIEGLNAALALELKRIVFYCDFFPLYQFFTGRWTPKQQKIVSLVNQVTQLRGKFTYCQPFLVARNDVKFAFKLAREAIVSQIDRPAESSSGRSLYETCVICFEDVSTDQLFSVDSCMHRFCYSCLKQHVEVKMLQGMVPKCPHEACISELNVDSCSKFLTPKLVETMKLRKKEASIPVTEKVYCPYPKCSALMSKSQVLDYSRGSCTIGSGARKCMECYRLFCIYCKVPWHNNMTCFDFKRRNPNPPAEDLKLKTLAARNLWRQCVKCNHMIELATGCYHMTCRCGCEFCYTCGAEWKDKKATCGCPLWDEDHIMYNSDEELGEEEDEFYESDSDYYY